MDAAPFDKASWFIPSVHHSLTTEEVKEVSDDLNYDCSPELIEAIRGHTSIGLGSLDVLDTLNGYLPSVKYPRTPGRKPLPQENPGNAWYVSNGGYTPEQFTCGDQDRTSRTQRAECSGMDEDFWLSV